jgi:hypothetical protein
MTQISTRPLHLLLENPATSHTQATIMIYNNHVPLSMFAVLARPLLYVCALQCSAQRPVAPVYRADIIVDNRKPRGPSPRPRLVQGCLWLCPHVAVGPPSVVSAVRWPAWLATPCLIAWYILSRTEYCVYCRSTSYSVFRCCDNQGTIQKALSLLQRRLPPSWTADPWAHQNRRN